MRSSKQPRYRAYNMHGPTVYADDDLREVCADAKRASRGTGGVWRVLDTRTSEWLAAYDRDEFLGLEASR